MRGVKSQATPVLYLNHEQFCSDVCLLAVVSQLCPSPPWGYEVIGSLRHFTVNSCIIYEGRSITHRQFPIQCVDCSWRSPHSSKSAFSRPVDYTPPAPPTVHHFHLFSFYLRILHDLAITLLLPDGFFFCSQQTEEDMERSCDDSRKPQPRIRRILESTLTNTALCRPVALPE